MRMVSLQSGSSGNCIYVETDEIRLLFDAGISGRQAEQRLAAHGRDIRDVDALVISHEHRDHARCMGIYQRKYGTPVHVTGKTLAASQARHGLGEITDLRPYTAQAVEAMRTLSLRGVARNNRRGRYAEILHGNTPAAFIVKIFKIFEKLVDKQN